MRLVYMLVATVRAIAVGGEEGDGVVGEEGVKGNGEVAGSEEDERPVEGETPDCGGVVEVDASGVREEVDEVERGPGRGLVAWRGGREERRVEEEAEWLVIMETV